MSIVSCKHCGKDVIETAAKCPHCDLLGPKKARRVKWMMLGLLVMLIIGVIGLYFYHSSGKKKSHEDIIKERLDDKISQRATTAAMLLRTKIQAPESLQIDFIKANEDGSVLCFQYKVKNSDGVIKTEKATFADGELKMNASSWSFYCNSKSLTEISLTKPAS